MKHLICSVIILLSLNYSFSQDTTLTNKVKLGDNFQGGIVFFIDTSGHHGLIAAPKNQTSNKVMWGVNGSTYAISPCDGEFNSRKILDFHNYTVGAKGKAAAYLCDTLTVENFSDWYLPSIDELKIMYDNQNIIGNILSGDYCSSTEYGVNDAYSIHFRKYSSIIYYYNKKNKDYFVRCIRKF